MHNNYDPCCINKAFEGNKWLARACVVMDDGWLVCSLREGNSNASVLVSSGLWPLGKNNFKICSQGIEYLQIRCPQAMEAWIKPWTWWCNQYWWLSTLEMPQLIEVPSSPWVCLALWAVLTQAEVAGYTVLRDRAECCCRRNSSGHLLDSCESCCWWIVSYPLLCSKSF